MRKGAFEDFCSFGQLFVAPASAARGSIGWISCQVMFFNRFDLPSPVFRGSKGSIRNKLSLQQLWRPLHICTYITCFSECVVYEVHVDLMRFLNKAPVCMGGEVFFAYRVFGSCFSLESSGWLRGCRAGNRSVRPCIHACIHRGPSGRYLVGFASMEA